MPKLHLGLRLDTAAELLAGCRVVADIGCDHGRLCCSLLQHHSVQRCIAADISLPSLEKAAVLSNKLGLSDRLEIRPGDGLSVLLPYEADGIAILGMGGKTIREILCGAEPPLMGAQRAVLQPMRGVEELRYFLYERGYHILEDRVIRESGRYYQIFSVAPPAGDGVPDPWPEGFPEGCCFVGYRAFEQADEHFCSLIDRMLLQTKKQLEGAGDEPGSGFLMQRLQMLQQIRSKLEERQT
ncbi:MAG: SAM-dependent methyltransferase [Firmicutes bacterium]|nr:SAM-dependent methyltransferase [Bacillota bacterium]